MSKIKLTGDASGSGTLTIAAPNTDTDYSVTLPEVDGGEFVVTGGGPLNINTAAADDSVTIDSSGNLLVGTTTDPSSSYNGFSCSTSGLVHIGKNTTGVVSQIDFYNPNGRVGYIYTTGSSTGYNTLSDYRLKTDVQPMTGATERLKALNPVNFEWISSGERVDGFLAHEAQEVVPEAVTGTKDAVDAEGNPDYQGIDQSKLVPLLVAAMQEQQAVIEDLTARIAALETA